MFDSSGSPVAGAEVYVDNVLKGITGSGAFGTSGYVKLYLAAGSHTIKAVVGSNENEALVTIDPLQVSNVNIIVDAASLPAENKLIASDGAVGDSFGHSVSTSGDGNTMVVGLYLDDDNGDASGSAYIYKWNGASWDETKIIASDGAAGDWFGYSISTSTDGNTIVVGAYQDDDSGDDSGSAYIYTWNGGSWDETKIIASDGAAGDSFGHSVSTSGDGNTIVVGAKYDDDNGDNSGSVYIYKWNGASWDETKITASDGAAGDYFGGSVSTSVDGDTIVLGASGDGGSGSAYIYKWNGAGWDETKINVSDGAVGDLFGSSVSTSGDGNTVAVGEPVLPGGWLFPGGAGSAYIYKWNGASWDETKIIASDGADDDNFGYCVSASGDGDTIVVGAYRDDDNGGSSGSVYIYR
ncbi:MAG: PKD domain-containing protein [bacterium]|nr:PKD domain-containing protein [bacterium]